jgi:hypothetical protein
MKEFNFDPPPHPPSPFPLKIIKEQRIVVGKQQKNKWAGRQAHYEVGIGEHFKMKLATNVSCNMHMFLAHFKRKFASENIHGCEIHFMV